MSHLENQTRRSILGGKQEGLRTKVWEIQTAGLYEVKISLEPVSTEFDGQEVVVEVGYLGLSSNSSK